MAFNRWESGPKSSPATRPGTSPPTVPTRNATGARGPAGAPGETGTQGPAGPPGSSSEETQFVIAAVPVPARRVVALDDAGRGYLADHDRIGDADRVLGISRAAALPGEPFEALTSRTLDGGTWIPGAALFLGHAGELVPTPPETGFVMQVAAALSASTLLVRIQTPFLR